MSLALVQRHWLENCFRRPRVVRVCNFYGVPVYFRRYSTQIHDTHTRDDVTTKAISFDVVTFAQAALTVRKTIFSNNYDTLFGESEIASITTRVTKKRVVR